MAEVSAQVVKLIVTFKDGYISNVERHPDTSQSDAQVSDYESSDKKKFRRSANGLRPLDTIYETTDAETAVGLAPKCYMIIGGFKVQVPCS